MYKAKYILYIVAILSIFLMFSGDSTFAENVDYNVNITPALTLTTSTNSLALNLDPSSKTFDSKNLTVSVGTNNKTGYKLTLSTPNDNTDLDRDTSGDTTAISATIPTLDTGTYTESTFTANKWGYSINSNTAIPSTVTSGFIPFVSGNTLMERNTAVNQDQTNLTFASKIDYLQPAGAYNTTLQFNIVANPLVQYMQDLNPALCTTTPMTVVDKRDNKEYTIARLADGQCWMTSNLNLAGGTTLNASDSDVPTDNYYTLPASSATGFGDYTKAYVYNTGNETTSQADCTSTQPCNSYYSWLAATAGGKDASGTAVTGNGPDAAYSICPKGWRLPKSGNQSDTSATSTTGYKKGDFYKLATAYGANLESSYYQNSAVFYQNAGPGTLPNFLLAGSYYSSTFRQGGSYGDYWSSSSGASTDAYDFSFGSGSYVDSAHDAWRYLGYSVRCILNDPRTISDITAMQEMNPQIAAKMNNGDTATLKDSRDGQDYTVAKINGNVWMTRNLAIGCNGTGSTYGGAITPIGLTPANTNITSSWTTPTDSLELGDSYDDPRMFCDTTYGAWYNYAAASAGTITGNSNTTTTTSDICPAGWRLASNTEFSSITGYVSAFNPTVGGGWDTGHVSSQHVGVYTSSIAGSAIYRYYLFYDGSSLSVNYSSSERFKGYYVRCIAK